jgi:ABC-type polysaccharide/polyol phosphate transport system ATPase subunit
MNMHIGSETDPHPPVKRAGAPAIRFENVSVRYRLPREGVSGVKEYAIRLLQRQILYDDFWALKGISFEVQRGEVFGVIGRNGAGKSTMLKVMARVLHPTEGRLVMAGRIAPLLELGGGFHPELTGRENIYLNMALLGYSRQQTNDLFDSIVDFAEIPDFIDAPLRTYSTGMGARLGFAVATCTQPDILLVDEVLSVGDVQFQQKCIDRMESFQQNGTTIVMVTHGMATVQTFCQRAMWLSHGKIMTIGDAADVVDQYIHQSDEAVQSIGGWRQSRFGDFIALDPERQVYPTRQIFDPIEGSLIGWIRFNTYVPDIAAVLFHTDDSRYVAYIQGLPYSSTHKDGYQFTARAGGNQRAYGKDEHTADFPEVSAPYEIDARNLNEWISFAMTWKGYPEGKLQLFVNGNRVGERAYDPSYSDNRPLPRLLAVGMRPLNWPGERVRQADGSYRDFRPASTMSATDAGFDLSELHLYKRALSVDQLAEIAAQGPELPHPQKISTSP